MAEQRGGDPLLTLTPTDLTRGLHLSLGHPLILQDIEGEPPQ